MRMFGEEVFTKNTITEHNQLGRFFFFASRVGLHVMSSRLDCDADTMCPLYGLIMDAGAI